MARSRATARKAGSSFERLTADGLAEALDDDRIDRMARRGSKDRGDIAGVRVWGKRLVIEAKDVRVANIPGWIREAHVEAGNDDALCGIVIAKRRGTTNPMDQYVHMQVRDLIALLTGQPQLGRYE